MLNPFHIDRRPPQSYDSREREKHNKIIRSSWHKRHLALGPVTKYMLYIRLIYALQLHNRGNVIL